MPRVEVRLLKDVEEYRQCEPIQAHVWGTSGRHMRGSDGGAKVRWGADRNSHRWKSGGFYLCFPRHVPRALDPLVTHDGGGSEVPGPGIWLQNEAGSPKGRPRARNKVHLLDIRPAAKPERAVEYFPIGGIGRRIPAGLLRALSQSFGKRPAQRSLGGKLANLDLPGGRAAAGGDSGF